VIKAALENPEEFGKLLKTISHIKMVSFKEDNSLTVTGVSNKEKNTIICDLEKVLDPSSQVNLNKESLYGGAEKLEKTLSAKFKEALGGEENTKKLISNLLDEKPSPSLSPRGGERGIIVKASSVNENSL